MVSSEPLAAFLDYLRQVPQQYNINWDEQKKQEDLTQDLLHHLELDQPDYRETARTGKRLTEARQRRRKAKDAVEALRPVMDYLEKNRAVIVALERLLGEVRKVEQRHQNRFYVPRVNHEEN